MKLNPFIWQNYRESQSGQAFIRHFHELPEDFLTPHLSDYYLNFDEVSEVVQFWRHCSDLTQIQPTSMADAEQIFQKLCTHGTTFYYADEEGNDYADHQEPDFSLFLDQIVPISLFLYCLDARFFKPYLFVHRFDELSAIFDQFGLELPTIPKKSDKQARFEFYWQFCQALHDFQTVNKFEPDEVCAFLYDFCPKFLTNQQQVTDLPSPTKAWFVGGNKGDFDFLDHHLDCTNRFWQGNLDAKIGDIIIMYCLSPRSYIHSIWRATSGGIADPFFYYYNHIHIGLGQKVPPISLNQLKSDEYFSTNPLVRKNFQGVNGFALSALDYDKLLEIFKNQDFDISCLPQLFSPDYELNITINNEKEVEEKIVEPLLADLGFKKGDWVRQLTVKMGRGEKVYPDYALLSKSDRHFEQAHILLETKFEIKNQREFEQAFRQVWSYGLRLSASLLIIVDKNCLWFFEKDQQGFDRNRYQVFYWKTLSNNDTFNKVQALIERHQKG